MEQDGRHDSDVLGSFSSLSLERQGDFLAAGAVALSESG